MDTTTLTSSTPLQKLIEVSAECPRNGRFIPVILVAFLTVFATNTKG